MGYRNTRKSYAIDPAKNPGPYEAIVRNVLDPGYAGSIQVEILKTLDSGVTSPTKQIITCQYLHPFYGTTNIADINSNTDFRDSQQSYGMWFVPPDVGNRVLVMFVEGNSNKAYWIGCIPQALMNMQVPGSTPATTMTDTEDPALIGKKLPVGEHNKSRHQDWPTTKPLTVPKPIHSQAKSVLETQGLLADETRGLTTSSSRREVPSTVFGINTPGPIDKVYSNRQQTSKNARLGGTSFVMDDGDDKFVRKTKATQGAYEYVNVESMDQETYAGAEKEANVPHNELFRIRTRTGHQILLHNSEDLVYIANANGTAWIEMTANGKIDFFAEDSVSVHSKGDFNFKTDRDFNLQAGRDINLKSATVNQESTTHNVLVSGAQTVEVTGQQTITTGNTNHYASGNINLDVGGLVNIANGIAVATPVSPLATWSLPGEANPTIMKRVPQHEPWSHHENYDPMAVALIKTDRSEQEDIVVAQPINIPDTFKNVRT
mgnify:FL=1|tara:strand:+ start:3772 stop:5238 length:1467 start_codon:yes stop_codon:yes gene_type:complete